MVITEIENQYFQLDCRIYIWLYVRSIMEGCDYIFVPNVRGVLQEFPLIYLIS